MNNITLIILIVFTVTNTLVIKFMISSIIKMRRIHRLEEQGNEIEVISNDNHSK